MFSDQELAQLRGFPEITRDELIRFFRADLGGSSLCGPRPGAFGEAARR